jgi:soluble P-type ATPase
MIELNIPNYGLLKIKSIVLDYNGTIAIDGNLIPRVREKIIELAKKVEIFILTADTYGNATKFFTNIPCEVVVTKQEDQALEKLNFVKSIGLETCCAIGNGNIDQYMLKEAKLGIAVCQQEGLAVQALLNSDIIVNNIEDAFDLLIKTDRLKATLRT